MKRYNQKSKKKLIILIPVLAVVAIASTATWVVYAVSQNTSVIENSAILAENGVHIVEDSVQGFGKKEVSFVNDGDNNSEVLLRIAYSETWTKSDGSVVSNIASNNNVVAKNWTTDFAADFVDGGDGWYYYKKTLAPNGSVQVLNSIALSDQSYGIYDYDLAFRFEAVQADSTAATTLWNKTASINNGVVTWTF